MITGSYAADDVNFLLKQIEAEYVTIEQKERLIREGKQHYSEMIHFEPAPDAGYFELFEALTAQYSKRLAAEAVGLSAHMLASRGNAITLVSLARAGTPVGALLQRILKHRFQADSEHYSVSIIRDRGIDTNALKYILDVAKRPAESLVFVDGWTAKGVITRELKSAIADWNAANPHEKLSDELYVISDIGGTADVAATADDYAIPSGILNAPVSGLLSRSILNDQIGPDDFHGTVFYEHLKTVDRTNWYLDTLWEAAKTAEPAEIVEKSSLAPNRQRMETFVEGLIQEFQLRSINLIKPGVAEATRVMLRRIPELLILRDGSDPDTSHLRRLAAQKNVPVDIRPGCFIKAAAIIAGKARQ